MLQFLESCNLLYLLLDSFILSKIDDTVAGDADTTKLMDLGLVYGDIISYRQMFPSNTTPKVTSYKATAQELKMKIQRAHSGRTDATKRPIHVNKVYNVVKKSSVTKKTNIN